jgi:ribosomal protein L11 methyltransferase
MKKTDRTYKEFIIRTEPFLPDIVSGVLWNLEIDGLIEEENHLKIYSAGKSPIGITQIEAILTNLKNQKLISRFIVEQKELENKNWNEEWEKTINIIKVTNRIIVKPGFRKYKPKKDQIVITIDPKMSFGTGEHQTTKLVLKILEKNIKQDCTALDMGTGTGILAIAAVKLGAKKVIAIDNDEWCFENASENCKLNSVSDKVDIRLTEIKNVSEKNFDFILANIQKNILIEIAPEIKKRLKSFGNVILSGLLLEDEAEICSCYNSIGFNLIQKEIMDEWIALLMKR